MIRKSFLSANRKMPRHCSPADLDAEMDFLPEFCHYKDEGCELAPSCLECPQSVCVEDELTSFAADRKLRVAALIQMHSEKHLSAEKLARSFHIGERTAYRILSASQNQKGLISLNLTNLLVLIISSFFFIPDFLNTLSDLIGF